MSISVDCAVEIACGACGVPNLRQIIRRCGSRFPIDFLKVVEIDICGELIVCATAVFNNVGKLLGGGNEIVICATIGIFFGGFYTIAPITLGGAFWLG